MEEITNPLKRMRIERKLTLRKLAEKADVDPSTISGIEQGRKRGQEITLRKLADALEIPFSVLESLQDKGASERGKLGAAATAKKEIASLKLTANNAILAI